MNKECICKIKFYLYMTYKKEEKDEINEKQAVVDKLCDNWTVKEGKEENCTKMI